MHDDSAHVEARLRRMLRDRIAPAVRRRSVPVTIAAWQVPDEPVPFAEAVRQRYEPFEIGSPWGGRPWGTTWFRVSGVVPADFGLAPETSVELEVDLGFVPGAVGFNAEGLAWRPDGSTITGIEPENSGVPIDAGPGEAFELFVEAAANPIIDADYSFRPTPMGSRHTRGTEPIYVLRALELVERDERVWQLEQDIRVLGALLAELPSDGTRAAEVLRALDAAADALDPDDVAGSAGAARAALAPVLARRADDGAHRTVAVGHAHIDSAWMWPARETVRKCARTWSNVLDLMDRDPDFVFAASSAQQYAWIRDGYPELFARIARRVAEGRWIPVGGMWVESDTNMPGGEALARQFVVGKRFFLEHFGIETRETWLPDSFGYSAALPQIARAAGNPWFLAQKASWNETNRLPHTSFRWEGIDGTGVLVHCPPADRYNSDVSAADLHRGERQNRERGVADTSMLLFGFGDGGGGPTREMLAAAHRQHDLGGSPRVDLGTPAEVFADLERDLPDPSVWAGEIYLEFHRGTYTSQLRTKQGNRRSEHLLREAELWAATAAVRLGAAYPSEQLEEIWRTVLLQQFHDILPGSSIAWVHEVAEAEYARVAEDLERIIADAIGALAAGSAGDASGGARTLRFNAAPVVSDGVPALGAAASAGPRAVGPRPDGAGWTFDTGRIRARIDDAGHLVSLLDLTTGREAIAPGARAAEYIVYRDTPNQYDAWDLDRTYQRHPTELTLESVDAVGDAVVVVRRTGRSTVTTRFTAVEGRAELSIASSIDWHEHEKLLKLAFPLDLKADRAASEIQFGHVERPTHQNTSWDHARFETSAHRWVHVAEPGFGVAVANDSTYGHDVSRRVRRDGGTTTLVRESLVRGPRYPDPEADQGTHRLVTVVRIAETVREAIDTGYRVNLPTREAVGAADVPPLVRVASESVIVEAVKLAEDRSGDVVVRLYEARGGSARAVSVDWGFPVGSTTRVDLLERPIEEGPGAREWDGGDPVLLDLRPFEIVTLRATRA